MLKLSLFGSFTVMVDGNPIPPPTRHKALELLALLALERGRSQTRTYLAEQLWLDAETSHKAMDNLRHTLQALRHALGDHADCIEAIGNKHLRLNVAEVQADYWEFEDCLTARKWQKALTLAQNSLLTGWSAEWISPYRTQIDARLDELRGQGDLHPLSPLPFAPPLTVLVGREEEEAAVHKLLCTQRLVTLVGIGGVGKTHLALCVAQQRQHEGATVGFVDLSVLQRPEHIPLTIAAALGEGKVATADPLGFLLELLRRRSLLLVLDNCEHLVEAVARLVLRLVTASPELRFLLTSREPLGIPGEKIIAVSPLKTQPASGLSDACQLLVSRVGDLLPDWEPDKRETPHLDAIATRLEGVPLLLELFASAVANLGAATVARDLETTLSVFEPSRKGGGRHETFRACLEWSLRRRSEPEQRFFRGICVFRGSFDTDAAAAVLSVSKREAQHHLSLLRSVSLISRIPDTSPTVRWRLLEVLREYGQEALITAGEVDAAEARHLDYFRAVAVAARPSLNNNEQVAAVAALLPDLDNLRAGVSYALHTPKAIPAALEMLHHAHRFWFNQALYEEYYTSVESLLQEAEAHAVEIALPLRLDVLDEAAGLAFTADQFTRARTLYQREWDLAQTSADELLAMNALYGLALLASVEGRYPEARSFQERVLRVREQEGLPHTIAIAHNGLGITMTRLREYDRARHHLHTSLRLKEADYRWTTSYVDTLHNLLVIEVLTRQWGQFAALAKELHLTIDRLGDNGPEKVSNFHNLHGIVLCEQGAFAEAKATHEASLAFFRQRDQSRGVAESLLGIGRVCLQLGEWERCEEALREARDTFEVVCDFRRVAECQEQYALLRARQMQWGEGATWLAKADALRAKIASPLPPLDQEKINNVRHLFMEAS